MSLLDNNLNDNVEDNNYSCSICRKDPIPEDFFFINPTMMIVPCMYVLCKDHFDEFAGKLIFEDFYDVKDGKIWSKKFTEEQLRNRINNIIT